ncbi:MAG TPA: hypothetical protein DD429_03040 [Clostridiaceae bacterium]|nr:hypothetical protein [Clostridiaceae bacterium]
MNLLLEMREVKDLTPSERQVVKYILENPEEAAGIGISELAKKTYTSTSTIMRLCKRLGIDGFVEFRQNLVRDLDIYHRTSILAKARESIEKTDSIEDIIEKVSSYNAKSIIDFKELNKVSVVKSVIDLMTKAECFDFYGVDTSNLVAQDAKLKAMRLGIFATAYDHFIEMTIASRISNKKRLAFMISYSGETLDIIKCAKILGSKGVPTVSITCDKPNSLCSLCDYNLFVSSMESVFRMNSRSGRIGSLNVIDILFTAYANLNYERNVEMLKRTYVDEINRSK